MSRFLDNLVSWSFYTLLFLTPLVFFPYSSELFEFNKLILVYALSVVIAGGWIGRMVEQKKFIFRRTLLDIPLLIFLASQLISTLFSIDIRTSIFGYYSRFNGGLLSLVCYAFLYWAYVANMDRKKTINSLYALIASAAIVSIYACLEHFGYSISCLLVRGGFDVACWQQDVQNRVFATLGQPNWLAAWIVALSPITWAFALNSNLKSQNSKLQLKVQNFAWPLLSTVFFLVLLYTKSRSGLIAFALSSVVYWTIILWKLKKEALRPFLILNSSFIILTLLVGTPWSQSVFHLTADSQQLTAKPVGPVLETGGTESAEIRKIVWKGALDIWKHYPVFGTGVETFAFSYYQFRPAEHNLVSEWDYLYNKAHNEYLNYLATTGSTGLLSYLLLIAAIISLIVHESRIWNKELREDQNHNSSFLIHCSILAGFISILVTNFAGFSVVVVSLLFFLYPAISLGISTERIVHSNQETKLTTTQLLLLFPLLCALCYALISISRYWLADYYFAKGKGLNDSNSFIEAREALMHATNLSPREAIFINELSQANGNLAILLSEAGKESDAKALSQQSQSEIDLAMRLSPRNLNIQKDAAQISTKMAAIDPSYLAKTNGILSNLVKLAPTDPKVKLNLGISYLRIGQTEAGEKVIREAVTIKPNYKEARFALAAILIDKNKKKEAIQELNYILEKIDPKDQMSKDLLEDIK